MAIVVKTLQRGEKYITSEMYNKKKLSPPYIGKIEVMLIVDKNYENTWFEFILCNFTPLLTADIWDYSVQLYFIS